MKTKLNPRPSGSMTLDQISDDLRAQLAAIQSIENNRRRLQAHLAPMDDVIKAHALTVLQSSRTITEAAKTLRVGRRTLHRWLSKWASDSANVKDEPRGQQKDNL